MKQIEDIIKEFREFCKHPEIVEEKLYRAVPNLEGWLKDKLSQAHQQERTRIIKIIEGMGEEVFIKDWESYATIILKEDLLKTLKE